MAFEKTRRRPSLVIAKTAFANGIEWFRGAVVFLYRPGLGGLTGASQGAVPVAWIFRRKTLSPQVT